MATRIRCTTGAAGVTPTSWIFAQQRSPVTVPGTTTLNTGLAMTSKAESTSNAGVQLWGMGRTVFGPLAAQTISGSVTGQMRGMESHSGVNSTLAVAIKLVTSAGADRATLLAVTASDAATAGHELVVSTLTNRPYETAAESTTLTLTSQTAQNGDYLVIEWGFRADTTTAGRTITLSYGNDSATDLTAGDTTETSAFNPWWEFSQTLTLAASTPTIDRSESLALTTPVFLRLPVLHVPAPLSELALSTTRTVTVRLAVRPTELLVLGTGPTLAAPLTPALLTAVLGLLETASVRLPWLTLSATTAAALTTTVSAHLSVLHAEGQSAVGLTDAPEVQRSMPGLLEVPRITETLALAEPLTAVVPVLAPMATEVLALASTASLRLPILAAFAASAAALTDVPDVQRSVEGLWEVRNVSTPVALTTTVTLRLPTLSLSVTETMALQVSAPTVAPVLVRRVDETVALGTTVSLRLAPLRPWGLTAVALVSTATPQVPVLRLQVTEPMAVRTVPDVTRMSQGVLMLPTMEDPLALGAVATLRLGTAFVTTDFLALTAVGRPAVVAALRVDEPVILEATSLLIVTLHGQSATTVALGETVTIQAHWIAVLTPAPLVLDTAVTLRGLARRGVHATTSQLRTTTMQGTQLRTTTMPGTLRQATVDDPVLI